MEGASMSLAPITRTHVHLGECAPVSVSALLFFCLCFTNTHEVATTLLCLYSPKSNLLEKVRDTGTIIRAGRLWQIVLQ